MAIKNSGQKSAAKNKKKKNFIFCDGCFGIFTAANVFQAPINKHNLKIVCRSCLNQYCGAPKPVPSAASMALKNQHGAFLTSGGAGLISNYGSGFISEQGGALISNKAGGILSNANGGLISESGSTLISNKSGGLITDNGAALIGRAR